VCILNYFYELEKSAKKGSCKFNGVNTSLCESRSSGFLRLFRSYGTE